jgi:hypothetical protein
MQMLLLGLSVPPAAQKMPIMNAFQLVQKDYQSIDQWGITPANWGTNKDFAPVWPWYRPVGLAIKLYNSAVQGDYHACTGAPSGVLCAAFLKSGQWTAALSNSNATTTAVTVTFPTGAVPTVGKTILYTTGMTDNNEDSTNVSIGSLVGGVSPSGQTVSVTMPAFAAVALTPGAVPTPTPGGGNDCGAVPADC